MKIVQNLPCQIFDRQLYPYSHHREGNLLTVSHVEFIYRSGTTLHKRKGHNDDFQEYEELLAFYTTQQERVLVIKNLRSHLAAAFRPIPVEEAKRIKISESNMLFAPDNDHRPVLEKNDKSNKKNKKWKYIQYQFFPYKILDQQALDLLKQHYTVLRTGQEWMYVNMQIQPWCEIEFEDQKLVCTQDFTLEIKGREGIRNIKRVIGDFEFASKKEIK